MAERQQGCCTGHLGQAKRGDRGISKYPFKQGKVNNKGAQLTTGMAQHRARWPIAEQTSLKLSALVGTSGAVTTILVSNGRVPYPLLYAGEYICKGERTLATVKIDNS
jgi:hypothetical protein